MLRVLAILLVFCGIAHSEESGKRESESKAQTAQGGDHHSETAQQSAAPTNLPPIINIYTAKHAGEEGHCTQPNDWKEWGSFAWCRSLEWIDAERIIAIWTIILGIATCILGIATWRLWRSTDRLVKGAENTAERQLRAYVSIVGAHVKVVAADNNRSSIKGNLQFKNSGQTPAYKFAPWAKIAVFDEGVESTEKDAAGQDAILGPGDTNQMHILGAPVPEATIEAIRRGKKTIRIWGEVSYADAFGNEYIFEHRSKIGPIRSDLNGWPVVAVRTTERQTKSSGD
jgi:hypothetical protein